MAFRSLRRRLMARPAKMAQNVIGVGEDIDQLIDIINKPSCSVAQRVTAAGLIRSSIEQNSLSSIPEVWYSVMSLLNPENQTELRRAGWKLVVSCIDHDEITTGSYNTYYHAIIDCSNVEDFDLVLNSLNALTLGGRRIFFIPTVEYRLPVVLGSWIQLLGVRTLELGRNPNAKDIAEQWGQSTPENFANLLGFTIGTLKFNMSIFEERDILTLLLCCCEIIKSQDVSLILLCMDMVDTIMAFGILPIRGLEPGLQAVCSAYMVDSRTEEAAGKLIDNLMKSHLALSTVQRLCKILEPYDTPNISITTRIAAVRLLGSILKTRATEMDSGSSHSPTPSSYSGREIQKQPLKENTFISEVMGAYCLALDYHNVELSVQIAQTLLSFFKDKNLLSCFDYSVQEASGFSPLNIICKLGDTANTGLSHRTAIHVRADEQDQQAEFAKLGALVGKLLQTVVDSLGNKDSVFPLEKSLLVAAQFSELLPQDTAQQVVRLFHDLHYCSPLIDGWQDHFHLILNQFYIPSCMTGPVRNEVLKICQSAYTVYPGKMEDASTTKLIFSVLDSADEATLEAILSKYRFMSFNCSLELFKQATSLLLKHFPNQSDSRSTTDAQSAHLAQISETFSDLFLELFSTAPQRAKLLYTTLVHVCKSSVYDPAPFKKAFALLTRLRCNSERLIYVTQSEPESDYGPALLERQVPLEIKPSVLYKASLVLMRAQGENGDDDQTLSIDPSIYLRLMNSIIQDGTSDAVYSLVLINLPGQLSNLEFFSDCEGELANLRNLLLRLISTQKIPQIQNAPPKSDIIAVYIHLITILLGYPTVFGSAEHNKLVQTLWMVMDQWDKTTANWALHCLVVCCYECPSSVQRFLSQILAKLQTKISTRDSSTHILEFLLTISLVESMTDNLNIQEFKRVFGICFTYIQGAQDTLTNSKTNSDLNTSILSQYLLRLAYSTIAYLFLAIEISQRAQIISYLVRAMVLINGNKKALEPISLTTYDLLCRYTYTNEPLRLTSKITELSNKKKSDEEDSTRWLIGYSVCEFLSHKRTGKGFFTTRRPTNTTVVAFRSSSSMLAANAHESKSDNSMHFDSHIDYLAMHWLMLIRGLDPDASNPIAIPYDTAYNRAISSIDRAPVVDFNKVGIIYIGYGQSTEHEVLANTSGSSEYRRFLDGIGDLVRLQGNREIYSGGLDTENDLDGKYTYAWVGKIAQITFHVITLMPNPEHDSSLMLKKRHIGNNYVNIFFDESGREFDFDLVRSQFNFINIVITPTHLRGKFRVRAYRKENLANVLAAYETKIVSAEHLPLFTRHLALKASMYAKVHNQHGEYTDQWLYRLDLINKLRERLLNDKEKQNEENKVEEDSEPPEIRELLDKLDFTTT